MVVGKIDEIMVSYLNVYNLPEEGPALIRKAVEIIYLLSMRSFMM